jgi:molybdopterin-guanine dinucleotide biosynthesis protein MobB
MADYPVFGICGYSGSGKTTLIEALVPALVAQGLRIAVLKHDCHGLSADREGKDSDRFFKAGADVVAQGPGEVFFRRHGSPSDLAAIVRALGPHYDVVLVEGHKQSPLASKLWLLGEGEQAPPPEAGAVDLVLDRRADRPAAALEWIGQRLKRAWLATPVYAGILIGGQSARMGRPKHLLPAGAATWVERTAACAGNCAERVALLGGGDVPASLRALPVLPDVEDAQGPLRGMLAAMRWAPLAAWLFLPCDTPWLSEAALRWLLGRRRPGIWAVLPRLADASAPEPLPGYYDPRAAGLLERVRGPIELAAEPNVAAPLIPADLAAAWKNVNSPAELDPAMTAKRCLAP